jgi:large subunit ribosomal protein L4
MKVDVVDINGKATGRKIDLPKEIFGVEPNEHCVYLAVKQYLANQRQGTHKAKERADITGSTRKIKRQKGTGTARAGSIKNPLFRGGGRAFGPRPRDYSFKLNKKVKRLARNSALSSLASEGRVMVIEDFTFDQPAVKELINVLNNLDLGSKKSLIVTGDYDKNLYLSARNLKGSGVMNAKDLNTYSILHAQKLVLSESAVGKIKETFA